MHGPVVEDGLRGEPSMSLGDIATGLTAMVEVLAAQAG
jgi:crotonobetainyl-CoA:carnitine CoA-transferase CaiB-like acyl-CoA transferase